RMGLFDNLLDGNAPPAFTPQDAFAGIMIAASGCDGHFADEEMENVRATLGRLKVFDDKDADELDGILDRIFKIYKREGVYGLLGKSAAALPGHLRDCVFANAADMILADGVVEAEEKQFLELLQETLHLDADTALTIVEVMLIKNRG
ncbi:MAG: tellurite resistance TerB family protein, partial [Planctomycetes bacterium]|nr:tellurite resistance TerB family protein [Planctomycetota bacterium]